MYGQHERLWRRRLNDLIKECKQQGIVVKFVADVTTRDYYGMNNAAAEVMGYKMPAHTIYVDKNQTDEDKYLVLQHELGEYHRMKDGHMKYFPAHIQTLEDPDTWAETAIKSKEAANG